MVSSVRVTKAGVRTEFVGGYFPEQLKRELEQAAHDEGRTLTQEMVWLLREALRKRNAENQAGVRP